VSTHPSPADLARTGPPEVARALERLEELEGLPVQGHVDVYGAVHRQLQDALATLDEA
jgi:riboflavin synthase alpha subunit